MASEDKDMDRFVEAVFADVEPQPVRLTGTICGEGCPAYWTLDDGDECAAMNNYAPTGRPCIWKGRQPCPTIANTGRHDVDNH